MEDTSRQELTVNESILLLKADVKVLQQGQDRNYNNLKDSQDTFHSDMKVAIKELKDDYARRLSISEEKIKSLESSRDNTNGGLKWASAVLTILLAVLAWVYISQQSIQDSSIDNLIKQVNKI